jgi:hypothetical protein
VTEANPAKRMQAGLLRRKGSSEFRHQDCRRAETHPFARLRAAEYIGRPLGNELKSAKRGRPQSR